MNKEARPTDLELAAAIREAKAGRDMDTLRRLLPEQSRRWHEAQAVRDAAREEDVVVALGILSAGEQTAPHLSDAALRLIADNGWTADGDVLLAAAVRKLLSDGLLSELGRIKIAEALESQAGALREDATMTTSRDARTAEAAARKLRA